MAPPLHTIDTHTGGEPTRVIVDALQLASSDELPALRESPANCLAWLEANDWIRKSLILEPRGAPWMVGAAFFPTRPISTDLASADHTIGHLIFFNNQGYLGMCGHGLIGVAEALRHCEKIGIGQHHFSTPAGNVVASLDETHLVRFENVPSYRYRSDVVIEIPQDDVPPGLPTRIIGDIAYGGNWFFIASLGNFNRWGSNELVRYSQQIMSALNDAGHAGKNGAAIDHIELAVPRESDSSESHSTGSLSTGGKGCRCFVLCPGGQYDRSPCGTGTSAKLACLAADGNLEPEHWWIQESMIGSIFRGSYRYVANDPSRIIPTIEGRAYVTAQTRILFDPEDPFRNGISSLENRT